MSVKHVAFGPDDRWVLVTTNDITYSSGLPTQVHNLLDGRYNKGQTNSPIRALAMDEDDGFFAVYKNSGWAFRSVADTPEQNELDNISCVTLGPYGSYIIIISDVIHWRGIPQRAEEFIWAAKNNASLPQRATKNNASLIWAALGYEGSYFLLFSDGSSYWGGSTASQLEEVLRDEKSINKVFLSASSDIWCVLFDDGSSTWSGNAPIDFDNAMKCDEYMSPDNISYLHSSINSEFSCGISISETAESLRNGEIDVEDIPCITVVQYEGRTWSLNNRRLWVFKQSEVDSIPVVFGTANESFKKRVPNRFCNDIKVRGVY